uniref:Uncharacterized protein n=1 Tax=Trichuris muris TaxID=70415 RepID=A0A5S6QEW6_TRIMR
MEWCSRAYFGRRRELNYQSGNDNFCAGSKINELLCNSNACLRVSLGYQWTVNINRTVYRRIEISSNGSQAFTRFLQHRRCGLSFADTDRPVP